MITLNPSELCINSYSGILYQGGTNAIRISGSATTSNNGIGTSLNQIQMYVNGQEVAVFDTTGLYTSTITVSGNISCSSITDVSGNNIQAQLTSLQNQVSAAQTTLYTTIGQSEPASIPLPIITTTPQPLTSVPLSITSEFVLPYSGGIVAQSSTGQAVRIDGEPIPFPLPTQTPMTNNIKLYTGGSNIATFHSTGLYTSSLTINGNITCGSLNSGSGEFQAQLTAIQNQLTALQAKVSSL